MWRLRICSGASFRVIQAQDVDVPPPGSSSDCDRYRSALVPSWSGKVLNLSCFWSQASSFRGVWKGEKSCTKDFFTFSKGKREHRFSVQLMGEHPEVFHFRRKNLCFVIFEIQAKKQSSKNERLAHTKRICSKSTLTDGLALEFQPWPPRRSNWILLSFWRRGAHFFLIKLDGSAITCQKQGQPIAGNFPKSAFRVSEMICFFRIGYLA